jgi:hypothetical protein
VSHDPGGSIAEADIVLGLRRGAAVFTADAGAVDAEQVKDLYR